MYKWLNVLFNVRIKYQFKCDNKENFIFTKYCPEWHMTLIYKENSLLNEGLILFRNESLKIVMQIESKW